MPVNGERGCLRALAKLKRQHPHLTTILSVGGPGKRSSGFPGISARAMTRVTFAASVREFVDKYSLDGVDSKDPPFVLLPFLESTLFSHSLDHITDYGQSAGSIP